MLLFGAGASVEAGVPSAYNMTKEIVERFRSNSQYNQYFQVVSFVVGGMLFEVGKNGENPLSSGVNVEDLFNAVQLLAERQSLEVAPFVGSWHAMVDEFDKIRPSGSSSVLLAKAIYDFVSEQIRNSLAETPSSIDAGRIDSAFRSALEKISDAALSGRTPFLNYGDSLGKAVENYLKQATRNWSSNLKNAPMPYSYDFDTNLSNLLYEREARPGAGQIFTKTNEQMISELKNLVWIESPKSVEHLGPIINLLLSQKRLVIATLNYDNGVELLCESQNVKCHTGIEEWSNFGNFDFSKEGVHLLKLHGSIDWIWERNVSLPDRPMRHSVIRPNALDTDGRDSNPAVIFGQRNKLTAEGPFLDLLRAFRDELFRSDLLTVVGYSFRDNHINVYISQWLNSDTNRVIRIINGENFESSSFSYVKELLDLKREFPHRVLILPKIAKKGLESIYGLYTGAF